MTHLSYLIQYRLTEGGQEMLPQMRDLAPDNHVEEFHEITAHLPSLAKIVYDLGLILMAAVLMPLFLRLRKPVILSCLIAGFVFSAHDVVSAQETIESISTIATVVQNVVESPDELLPADVEADLDAYEEVVGHPPLPDLIHDLGLILIAATVMLLIFKWLKQPVILGYLIAGFIVSPFFLPIDPKNDVYSWYEWLYPYLPAFIPQILHVQDHHSIEVWAEIGVIFMLFGLGLEFSFKKLLANGRVAAVAGGFEVVSTTIIGYFVGQILGWDKMHSIFFGAMLAMSSTTIILKVFDELKLKGKAFAPIVFGALIVEDILAMLLLVMLGSLAVTKQFAGGTLFFESMKLVFFLVLWFAMGIYLIPWFLKWCRKLLNDEILLLVSVGLCFLMVIIACGANFSSALGAFVMGSILAETSKGSRIEHIIHPVKDLFSAVFFVSVGMMINPAILYEYAGTIVIITILTVFIKFWGTGMGALLAGCSIRNSMCAGLSMAQIGEFSFIIAMLGLQLKAIEPWLFSVVIATSAVTTLTTPYLILCSGRIANWLDHWVPDRVHLLLARYESVMNESFGRENILHLFWRVHGLAIMLNSVVLIGIGLGGWLIFGPLNAHHDILSPASLAWFIGAVIVALPFLAGVFRSRRLRADLYDQETLERLRQLQFGVSIFRFIVGLVLVFFITSCFMGLPSIDGGLPAFAGMITTACIVIFLFVFGGVLDRFYYKIESRFISNLSDKERAVVEDRSALPQLAPWEATLTEYMLSEYSPLVMKTVRDSNLKQDFGVTVAIIRRGQTTIVAPKADEKFLPRDHLYLIGTYEQLVSAQAAIEFQPEALFEFDDEQFGMVPLRLHQEHSFVGKMIRECGIRESVNGLIVGLERGGERFLNPEPDMVIENGDVIWLVGERNLLARL